MSIVSNHHPEILDDLNSRTDDLGRPAPSKGRKPRPKPARSIRLCVRPAGGAPGVVRIAVGKEQADYFLTVLSADFGRGFKVDQPDATTRSASARFRIEHVQPTSLRLGPILDFDF